METTTTTATLDRADPAYWQSRHRVWHRTRPHGARPGVATNRGNLLEVDRFTWGQMRHGYRIVRRSGASVDAARHAVWSAAWAAGMNASSVHLVRDGV